MKTPHPVHANPITARVALWRFPLDMNWFAKVEARITGFTGTD